VLIGNRSVLHKSPGRFLAGTIASADRSNFSKPGMLVSRFERFNKLSGGIPGGHLSPSSWALPRTAGGMSAINEASASVTAAGFAVGGVTTTGSSTITITVADAAGELISSGSGAASFSFTVGNLLLTASLNGVGSASFALVTNTPELGALAGLIGSSTMSFTGSLTPYAIGSMSGSTVDTSVLTIDAIAAGVLAAAATSPISADIRKVNTYPVDGTGQPGAEWGPV
jgi:hypothetical protein